MWRSTIEANELGLWRATDGTLNALANVGPANPREFTEVTSTTEVLAPLANATGGDVVRIEDGSGVHLPRIVAVRSSDTYHGRRLAGTARTGSERGARHRRAAGIRRTDRAPAPRRKSCRHLDARRPLTKFR